MNGLVWQPLLPVWLIVVVAVAGVGFAAWRAVAERSSRRMMLAWVRRGLIVALMLVVVARPGIPGGSSQASVAELNVYFVVDTTSSSVAQDWDGDKPRLDGMRSDIERITDDLAGARFSLITFDSSAQLRVPLTSDSSALVTAVKAMRQEITKYSHGSSISEANSLLASTLASAHRSHPQRANVVYYLGDGEQTISSAPGSFSAAHANTDGGGVLGYGTSQGGRMRTFDGYGDEYSTKSYIKDTTKPGDPDAISHIDPANLRTIAAQLGVPYLHREAGASLASVVDPAKRGHIVSEAGRTASMLDLYWVPAILVFLLLFVEIAVVARALGEVRSPRRSAGPGPGPRRPQTRGAAR
ncbi:VWA domain-containing protein [Frondihabitans australicus]|uniref:Ca-activated chloride channel family protein n=1 Tax=Frondihabitans australicus TaxID=386892 RepID=A0A495IF86_9MICO|nr:VWA domain-containing protein [Frondihabitans australicus]RKR73835.1 Ca-activated chloride channel family protein [Frondihabitans australicus]